MTVGFASVHKNGIVLKIRLTPEAKKTGVLGIYTDSAQTDWLKIGVNAPAVDGKANKALIMTLSKIFKLPKTVFEIIKGLTDRQKTILIIGQDETLLREIEEYVLFN